MPGAIDELLANNRGGGAAPSPSSGGGGAIAELLKNGGGPAAAPAKKTSGFFGVKLPLIHTSIGVHTAADNPLTQAKNVVAGALPGLVRLGGSLFHEGVAIQGHNQKTRGVLGALPGLSGLGLAQNLFRKEDRKFLKEKAPVTYQLGTSPIRTARQAPDLGVGLLTNKGSLGQRAANTDIGRQVHQEGVLSTGLAKVADIATLAGGVGLIGKAAGAGRLAEAADLERLASATSEAAKLGKVANESTLAKAAMEAEAAGDAAKAADLARAADQMSKASNLRRFVEQSGKGEQVANEATAKAASVAHLGGRVAAAPFVPTEKALGLVGKGIGLAAKSERLAPYVERAGEAMRRGDEKRAVGNQYHEDVRAPHQAEMHTLFERYGIEKVARGLSNDEQAAVYIGGKSLEGLTPGVREAIDAIGQLPEEVRPDALKRAFGDAITPEQYDLARRFHEGTLPAEQQAKMQAASDALTVVQEHRQGERYVPGKGTSKPLSEAAKEARAQRAAGQSAEMDVQAAVDKATGHTRSRLAAIQDEANTIHQTPAEAVPNTLAQERRLARDAERTRRAGLTVKGEETRGERTMSRASQIIEKNQRAAANREGQVIGRARERMSEQTQLGKPSRGEVQNRISRDSRLANEKSKAENSTANKILGEHATEQQKAVAKAQKKLSDAQSAEAARRDKFETENQVRGEKAQDKRLATLDKQHAAALDKLAKQEQAARDSIAVAPPQNRPALQVAHRVKEMMLEAAEAYPEQADHFLGLADDIADTQSKLEAKGVKTEYFFGGKADERMATPAPNARYTSGRKLQSERNRLGVSLQRNIGEQTKKYARETLDMLHNEFRGKFQKEHGSTVADELGIEKQAAEHAPAGSPGRPDFNPSGEELAAQLAEHDLVAWDPATGKALDAKDVTPESAVLPQHLHEALNKWTATPKQEGAKYQALRVYDYATKGWKHTVLAMSPRWHAGNIIGNAALATLGAGLSPAQIAANLGEARRLVKDFEAGKDIAPQHVAAMQRLIAAGFHNPDLATVENAGRIGRLMNKSYAFNEYVDSLNRTMVYLAKEKTGVSSEAAVQMALKAAGDFTKMTPMERNVARRIVPFYAWQRHITRLAMSLPIEAPARVAWTLHLSELENQVNPDPGKDNEFNDGTIPFFGKRLSVRSLDPYGSSFWMDPSFRGAGYSLNPILKLGTAAATGMNLNKGLGGMVSGKFRGKNASAFGAPAEVMGLKHPQALAKAAATSIPQVRSIQDLLAGDVPVRYDTGEPRKVGAGAAAKNAKPTLTGRGRIQTLARFLGIPIPETETKSTTKKKKS